MKYKENGYSPVPGESRLTNVQLINLGVRIKSLTLKISASPVRSTNV